MGESGIVFLVVPIAYGVAFVTLLLAAILVAFAPKWRFLSVYFVAAALAAIPAFVLWMPCVIWYGKLATIIESKNLSIASTSVMLPCSSAPLRRQLCALALASL
jgi:hypothetical protein